MSEKTLNNIRIVNKHDIESNWLKATGFTPKQGELIVYDIDENYSYERLKIGDGVQNVNDLPFVQDAEHTHDDATTTTSGFMSAEDKAKLDTAIVNNAADTTFVGNNNIAVLQGGTINIAAEHNLSGVRIYRTGKTTSGAFYIQPNDSGQAIKMVNENKAVKFYGYNTGDVALRGVTAPTYDNEAANKLYVDTTVSAVSTLIGDTSVSQQISDAIAQIDYPVDSVNGKTGAVQLTASDVGALPDTTVLPDKNVFTASTTSTSSTITATCEGFTYTVGNIVVLTCDSAISTSGYRSLNINSLGAKYIYTHSTSSTAKSLYGYSGVIGANDTLILMYDQYDHFVVISHFDKEIKYEDLASGVTNRLGPSASSAEVGQFVRLGEGGYWVAETVNIPSIEGLATETYVNEAVAAMVDSAPETLNTLNELAAALGDDPNFATTIATQIGNLESKVGDTSVSDQITAANMIYVGPDKPTDPNIKVWINTSEEGTGVVPVLPRISTITLAEANWTGNSSPYAQVVDINTVTSATKIDLQPTVSQIVEMQNADIALMAENLDGVVTIYSFGGKPIGDMTMQVLLTEVSYV